MIRILHTADVHLDAPLRSLALRDEGLRAQVEAATRGALTRLVDTALSESVDAVLIAGDLFDGRERSARTAAFLLAELDRLRVAGIRVFYIKGNHDADNPVTGMLDLPDNVHLFGARGGKVDLAEGVWIHGVGFEQRHVPESLLSRFPDPVPGAVNIAMLHTSLAGAPGHDNYAPCRVSELAGMGFDYWALGHVHKREVHATDPWIVMPGCPQGRDIGEAGAKSATLLTIEDSRITVTQVPTALVEFAQTALDISQADSDDALRAALRAHLDAVRAGLDAPTGVLRVTLTGTPPRYWQILRDRDVWQETVVELAAVAGDMWIDRLVFHLSPPEARRDTPGASEELRRTMDEIAGESGFRAAARAEVAAVLEDLPPALRARLAPDDTAVEALTDGLAQTGAAQVLARLKGAEG
ncbi:DNA repair exonuclease [Rhodobacteraceae bacterium W635]|uniref:metallophosphoesterase family protein n=1 Tax=Nioella halotolerans TaxID=2303578 RepID=UPI000E3BDAAE|nr:DNA repair exonuclease [Rhodobacteraceae bacterium W635]